MHILFIDSIPTGTTSLGQSYDNKQLLPNTGALPSNVVSCHIQDILFKNEGLSHLHWTQKSNL